MSITSSSDDSSDDSLATLLLVDLLLLTASLPLFRVDLSDGSRQLSNSFVYLNTDIRTKHENFPTLQGRAILHTSAGM